jgi:hypothetical protein
MNIREIFLIVVLSFLATGIVHVASAMMGY